MSSARGRSVLSEPAGTFDIGIVGAGWISSAYHLPILDNLDAADVTFVADIDGRRARKVCRGYDAKPVEVGEGPATLPPCDVIVLAIPVGVRPAYISEFADRNVAIFSEKPFAVDTEMHEEFLRMAGIISCNYMRHHYNVTRQLQGIVQSEMLGELERVELIEEGKTGATGLSKDHFQTDPKKGGGGILLERGCHSLSQLCEIFDGNVISVTAADITRHDGLDSEVEAVLQVESVDSVVEVDYHISRIRPIGSRVVLEFENEQLEADPYDPESRVNLRPRTDGSSGDTFELVPNETVATSTHQAMYLRWKAFLSGLAAGNVDSEAETMPLVTELISEIYDVAA